MKNYFLLSLTLLISNTIFSQNETFIISNESKKNETVDVFEITKKTIQAKKFENQEIDNPEYILLVKKIDSLNNEIKKLKNKSELKNILGLRNDNESMIIKLQQKTYTFQSKIQDPFHPVEKKVKKDVQVGEIERVVLLISTINSFTEIQGKFIILNSNAKFITKDFKSFVKNEIISTADTFNEDELHNLTENGYIIKNIEDNKIYFIDRDNLNKIAIEENEFNFLKILKTNNIKVIEENRTTYVTVNGAKCILTNNIKQELLNNNINIIQQTASAVTQYDKYYVEALKNLDVVTKHYQSYKSRTMTTSRLEIWKIDIKKLISINQKMNDIHFGKYKNDTSSDLAYQYFIDFNKQLTTEQMTASNIISDMIRECKIRTGI